MSNKVKKAAAGNPGTDNPGKGIDLKQQHHSKKRRDNLGHLYDRSGRLFLTIDARRNLFSASVEEKKGLDEADNKVVFPGMSAALPL